MNEVIYVQTIGSDEKGIKTMSEGYAAPHFIKQIGSAVKKEFYPIIINFSDDLTLDIKTLCSSLDDWHFGQTTYGGTLRIPGSIRLPSFVQRELDEPIPLRYKNIFSAVGINQIEVAGFNALYDTEIPRLIKNMKDGAMAIYLAYVGLTEEPKRVQRLRRTLDIYLRAELIIIIRLIRLCCVPGAPPLEWDSQFRHLAPAWGNGMEVGLPYAVHRDGRERFLWVMDYDRSHSWYIPIVDVYGMDFHVPSVRETSDGQSCEKTFMRRTDYTDTLDQYIVPQWVHVIINEKMYRGWAEGAAERVLKDLRSFSGVSSCLRNSVVIGTTSFGKCHLESGIDSIIPDLNRMRDVTIRNLVQHNVIETGTCSARLRSLARYFQIGYKDNLASEYFSKINVEQHCALMFSQTPIRVSVAVATTSSKIDPAVAGARLSAMGKLLAWTLIFAGGAIIYWMTSHPLSWR